MKYIGKYKESLKAIEIQLLSAEPPEKNEILNETQGK